MQKNCTLWVRIFFLQIPGRNRNTTTIDEETACMCERQQIGEMQWMHEDNESVCDFWTIKLRIVKIHVWQKTHDVCRVRAWWVPPKQPNTILTIHNGWSSFDSKASFKYTQILPTPWCCLQKTCWLELRALWKPMTLWTLIETKNGSDLSQLVGLIWGFVAHNPRSLHFVALIKASAVCLVIQHRLHHHCMVIACTFNGTSSGVAHHWPTKHVKVCIRETKKTTTNPWDLTKKQRYLQTRCSDKKRP